MPLSKNFCPVLGAIINEVFVTLDKKILVKLSYLNGTGVNFWSNLCDVTNEWFLRYYNL